MHKAENSIVKTILILASLVLGSITSLTTAEEHPMNATNIAQSYFEHMRAQDLNVVELFHEDAQLLGLGRRTKGKVAIKAFYTEAVAVGGPQPQSSGPMLSDGSTVAAPIDITLSDGSIIHAVDIFVIEDGKIRSLTYFLADIPAES